MPTSHEPEPPIITAVPGLGLGAESWRGTLEALGAGPASVRLLPGYGTPVDTSDVPTPAELATVLVAGLDEPVTLLGHSSSCQVVAQAALLAPDLVRRLVLVGPTTDQRAVSWPALGALWLRTAAHEDPRQLPVLVRQYRRTTLRSMRATMDVARHDDIRRSLAALSQPVVLVRGARDRIARGDWLRSLAEAVPHDETTVIELPAGAHMVPLTHPQLLAAHLASALATHSASEGPER